MCKSLKCSHDGRVGQQLRNGTFGLCVFRDSRDSRGRLTTLRIAYKVTTTGGLIPGIPHQFLVLKKPLRGETFSRSPVTLDYHGPDDREPTQTFLSLHALHTM